MIPIPIPDAVLAEFQNATNGDAYRVERPVPDRANGRLGLTRPDVPLLADVLDALGRAGHVLEVAP